jgi:LmbE family N-acetylglucosaminyl deacetylase
MMNRRLFVKSALSVGLPFGNALAAKDAARTAPLRVVCVGGHPDDPESGCAGTLARYAEAGHAVTVIYLTRGERGIQGKSDSDAAAIRTAECEAACKALGARAVFAGQIDGSTEVTRGRVDQLHALLVAEKPDVVFSHWPIDTHFDHQAASMLALCAWRALEPRPALYFFEVNTGSQTQGFSPDTYVDISGVVEKK